MQQRRKRKSPATADRHTRTTDTFAQHQYPTDAAAVTTIPDQTAQQRTGTSAAASSAQPNSARTSLQQTLPITFYGPDMQAQILTQKQVEQDAQLQLQQACARNAAVHAAAKAAHAAQATAQQAAATLLQQALPAGPPPPAAQPTTTTTATSLPSRVRALLPGAQPAQAQSILLTMAGAVPENAIPPAILEKMTMDDHAAVADEFLQQTKATDISSIPPFGASAFSHFWSFVTRFQLEAKEKQASSGAETHAGRSAGKFLKGVPQKRHHFVLIISIGQLEATADADGDIGRSSQLDHSKELDLYFSELYWSSFLGSVQKNRYRNKTTCQKKMCLYVFARKKNQRTQIGFS